ncbi:MAG: hypothetical protein ACXW31_12770 [Thermoanaerobaculia bacterium]
MKEWTEEDWQRFEDALRTREPWDMADELRLPPPDLSRLRSLASKLDADRTAAKVRLEPVLTSLSVFTAADVANNPAFRTPPMVSHLTAAAVDLYEREPQFALATATAAVTIAENLAAVNELPTMSLLGFARVERGKVLFRIGRYRDAEEDLRRADEAFDVDPHATEWEHARASLVRANVLAETHRFEDAVAEAKGAARAFEAFGDTARFLAARLLVANVLYLKRDFRAAASVLDELAEEARRVGDLLHLACALQNGGNCAIELGEHQKAGEYFFAALTLWNELGAEVERVRTRWSIGALLRAKGDLEGAIEHIDSARRAFEKMGVVNDAALARLELAEALLLAERPDEVPDLLRNVVVSFTSEGIMHNAKIALAYLREAVEAGALEPRIIRHVRDYLEDLPTNPASVFLPLR